MSRLRTVVVGITGGVASGKKRLATQLEAELRLRSLSVLNIEHETNRELSVLPSSSDCVLLHGLTVLDDTRLRPLFHVKVFLDVDADVRMEKLLCHDSKCTKKLSEMRHFHQEHVLKQKKLADVWMENCSKAKVIQLADLVESMRSERAMEAEGEEPEEVAVYLDKYEKAPDPPVPGDFI